jgi:hypothetical protein
VKRGGTEKQVQRILFGIRVQKMMEKVSPAKKVDAARAGWPARKPRMAEALQQHMITTIATMIQGRRRSGAGMVWKVSRER